MKLGKLKDVQSGVMQKVEILCALQKLGEKLSDEENKFVSENINNNMKQFELASTNIGIEKKQTTILNHRPRKVIILVFIKVLEY